MDVPAKQLQDLFNVAIQRLTQIHRDSPTDLHFAQDAHDVLRTLLNNVHLVQSISFATLVSQLKRAPEILVEPSHIVFKRDSPLSHRAQIDMYSLDVEQCCARIGKEEFSLEDKEPEFLDAYPAGTYVDKEGIVYGRPCCQTIECDEFIMGNIFCPDHAKGYDDIRLAPNMA